MSEDPTPPSGAAREPEPSTPDPSGGGWDDFFAPATGPTPDPAPDEDPEGHLPPVLHRDDGVRHSRTGRLTNVAIVLAVLFPVAVVGALVAWVGLGRGELGATGAPAAQSGDVVVVDDGAYSLWARNADGSAVRWNPCEPIRWVFNPNGAPLGAVAELQKAMERITEVSGITFDYLGETDELPSRGRPPWLPERYEAARWAPVLVAWRTPDTTDAPLGEHDRAVAIPVAVGNAERRVFVTAQVVFNEDLAGTPGFTDRRRSIGITMLHELLHVIGLGHVDDTDEIMFPFPVAGAADFGTGDVAGMAEVGAENGCLEVPEPEPIEVTYAG